MGAGKLHVEPRCFGWREGGGAGVSWSTGNPGTVAASRAPKKAESIEYILWRRCDPRALPPLSNMKP